MALCGTANQDVTSLWFNVLICHVCFAFAFPSHHDTTATRTVDLLGIILLLHQTGYNRDPVKSCASITQTSLCTVSKLSLANQFLILSSACLQSCCKTKDLLPTPPSVSTFQLQNKGYWNCHLFSHDLLKFGVNCLFCLSAISHKLYIFLFPV